MRLFMPEIDDGGGQYRCEISLEDTQGAMIDRSWNLLFTWPPEKPLYLYCWAKVGRSASIAFPGRPLDSTPLTQVSMTG